MKFGGNTKNVHWLSKNTEPIFSGQIGAIFKSLSISPTFYGQLLRQNPFAKKLQNQIVST
jgi:hypothetical protein